MMITVCHANRPPTDAGVHAVAHGDGDRAMGSEDRRGARIVVSSDCHAGAPPAVYATYLAPEAREEYPGWLERSRLAGAAAADDARSTITQGIGGISLDPFGTSIRERFYRSAPVE